MTGWIVGRWLVPRSEFPRVWSLIFHNVERKRYKSSITCELGRTGWARRLRFWRRWHRGNSGINHPTSAVCVVLLTMFTNRIPDRLPIERLETQLHSKASNQPLLCKLIIYWPRNSLKSVLQIPELVLVSDVSNDMSSVNVPYCATRPYFFNALYAIT